MSSVRTPSRPSETTTPKDSSVADRLSGKAPRAAQSKQVRLKLVYVDFWSAVKLSFLISAAIGVVIVVAVLLIWMVLSSTGIFNQLNDLASEVTTQKVKVTNIVSFAQVMGFTIVIAALNVVVGTVLGAIACLLYNLSVKVTGGVVVGFVNQQ